MGEQSAIVRKYGISTHMLFLLSRGWTGLGNSMDVLLNLTRSAAR